MSSLNEAAQKENLKDEEVAETPTFGHLEEPDGDLEVVEAFDDMDLKERLLRGIYAYGWEAPSFIQQRAITPVVKGRDTIAQAQSGKGKTGAFTVAALQRVDRENPSTQALMMSPSRELAQQTFKVASALAQFMDTLTIHCCMGGTSVRHDIETFRRGVQVVSATPGRTLDMICRGYLDLSELKLIVLDEADEMLSRGFKEAVYEIFSHMPQDVQVCLFSATMSPEALKITERFMRSPATILVKNEDLTLDGIRQFYINVGHEKYKFECLKDLYSMISIQQCIIYLASKKRGDILKERLLQEDFMVSLIHGGLDMDERTAVMNEFREGRSRVLLSTDLTARGIDVYGVSLVINYDLPRQRENYIHRIGRSGRYGRKGNAINFITDQDAHNLLELERFYSTCIEELPGDDLDSIFC